MNGVQGSFDASICMVGIPERSTCNCCLPCTPLLNRFVEEPPVIPILPVFADPADIVQAARAGADISHALQHVFGEAGCQELFASPLEESPSPTLVAQGGMNHFFMVEHAGRLVKCIRPQPEQSEACEAERLRKMSPSLEQDVHAAFPLASFACQDSCELLVFTYFGNSRSLGEVVRAFERTHPAGVLQSNAACPEFRQSGSCEHIRQLRSLLVEQVPLVGKRFQTLHGRRHGDFKADNVLIEETGSLRLVDFLSPFCRSCDHEEFLASTLSMHPIVQELRAAFTASWQACTANIPSPNADNTSPLDCRHQADCCALDSVVMGQNVQLMESLRDIEAAWKTSRAGSLFGTCPSLLDSIGGGLGIGNLDLKLPPIPAPSLLEVPPVAFSAPQELLLPLPVTTTPSMWPPRAGSLDTAEGSAVVDAGLTAPEPFNAPWGLTPPQLLLPTAPTLESPTLMPPTQLSVPSLLSYGGPWPQRSIPFVQGSTSPPARDAGGTPHNRGNASFNFADAAANSYGPRRSMNGMMQEQSAASFQKQYSVAGVPRSVSNPSPEANSFLQASPHAWSSSRPAILLPPPVIALS